MAAYAALVTLINLMEDMQNHPLLSTSLDQKQMQSLGNKAHFLLNFIETYNSRKESKDLEIQIASAAQEAEDVIESRIVNCILAGDGQTSSCCGFPFICKKERVSKSEGEDDESRLHKVITEMDSIKEKIAEIEEKAVLPKDESPLAASPRPLRAQNKTATVGIDDELHEIVDLLTGSKSARQIISIVGMCGVGKTTLAKIAYENPLFLYHFDIRAWASVSIKPNVRDICHQLLSCHEKSDEPEHELADRLHKTLIGRRYLIVLDDVWGFDLLGELRFLLPDNGNGSRIVITSRHIRNSFCSYSLQKNLLDMESSWKLFCAKVFEEDDGCPSELEGVGKKIVEACIGLPLSIVVIGGYLSKSSRRKGYWEDVSDNVNYVLGNGEDERCGKILSLSYNHLPAHLKPCFLYTGFFPEVEEISVSKLVQLWVAEGLIKPSNAQSLEEIAEGYLEDLVSRNLIVAHRRGQRGNIVACKVLDILQELCIMMAEKEDFLCVLRLSNTPRPLNCKRRVAIHGGHVIGSKPLQLLDAPLVRSLIFNAGADDLLSNFKLLKILSVIEEGGDVRLHGLRSGNRFHEQYVSLRYLHHGLHPRNKSSGCIFKIPSSVSRLWNLQTLILEGNFHAPPQIWEMLNLRHVVCDRILLPDPPSKGKKEGIVLQNLHTLSEAEDFRVSGEVCARIPNIKNLRMFFGSCSTGYLDELKSLTRLESLTCEFSLEEPVLSHFARFLKFPSSLRELCLIKCCLGWEDLTVIGSLPCLEVLKLSSSIKGNEWSPVEREFECLRYLEIWGCDDLIKWNAERSHFPVLVSLTLQGLTKLGEIPPGIGDIPTLERIELDECSLSAANSAMRILEKQESYGNEHLQLQVCFRDQEDCWKFKEMVDEEGLNTNHLRLVTK